MENLVKEIREGYQIPPFFTDDALTKLINQSKHFFTKLDHDVDFENDLVARELLINRVFYAFNKKLDEYSERYSKDIISWQLSNVKD